MKSFILTIIPFLFISASIAQEVIVDDIIYQNGSQSPIDSRQNILLPNNIAFESIRIHLRLSRQEITQISPEEESLTTLKELQDLSQTDIIGGLTIATNRSETLINYLTQTSIALQKGDILISFLKQEIALLQLDMHACLVDKSIADKAYFDSVNAYNQSASQKALNSSVISDSCASQNRIQYNAKVYLLNKITFFTSILQQKYDLLFNDQDTILNHFDVISDSMLTKLNAINEALKLYQF